MAIPGTKEDWLEILFERFVCKHMSIEVDHDAIASNRLASTVGVDTSLGVRAPSHIVMLLPSFSCDERVVIPMQYSAIKM